MSFKLEKGLSPQPTMIEIADFWEIECLRKKDGSASITDIRKAMQISEDVQEHDDDIQEIRTEGLLDDVSSELMRRAEACGKHYPFRFDETGYTFCVRKDIENGCQWLYLYLLCATRHKMGAKRIVNGIDGSLLFEHISKDILVHYLGQYSDGFVFGTANRGDGFYDKLEELTAKCGEGVIREENELTYNPQDDKLDVVAWIPFLDGHPSKIICFGQCKTGTSWHDKVEQLRADSFVKKWFSTTPSLTPMDAFMITDIVDSRDFFHRSVNKLFFDRCRLMNFAFEVNSCDWYDEMVVWTKSVLELYEIGVPSFAA